MWFPCQVIDANIHTLWCVASHMITKKLCNKEKTVIIVHLFTFYVCSRPWTREESFVQTPATFLSILVWYVESKFMMSVNLLECFSFPNRSCRIIRIRIDQDVRILMYLCVNLLRILSSWIWCQIVCQMCTIFQGNLLLPSSGYYLLGCNVM